MPIDRFVPPRNPLPRGERDFPCGKRRFHHFGMEKHL